MSFSKRLMKFCNDNVVLITGVSIIVAFHWGWWKMQNIPQLVDPTEKKELPIILGARNLKKVVIDKYNEFRDPVPKEQ